MAERARLRSLVALLLGIALGLAGAFLARDLLPGTGAPPPGAADAPELWTCGMHPQVIRDGPGTCPICGMALTPVSAGAGAAPAGGEREIAYWWDPMTSPPYVSDGPGRSPMGMELVPVYADEISAGEPLLVDPAVVQNMGLSVAPVVEEPLVRTIRAFGVLEEPEPGRHDVNLRVDGWVRKLHADVEGMRVAAGDPLFDLYSPALSVAVEELIGARRLPASSAAAETVRAAAARKLELLGLAPSEVERLAALDAAPDAVTFTSPADGFLVEKSVYAGSAVAAGDTVMRIADVSTLWLDAQVFQRDATSVRVGMEATATVDGFPGETFRGAVVLVHPRVDRTTRTARVRVELENPDLALRAGAYATVFLRAELAPRALVVPREAVIDTGERKVAFVALDMARFEPRDVEIGATGDGGLVQVLSGLAPGERVVVSGQFLLDAESRMKEAVRRFLRERELPVAPAEPGGDAEEPAPLPLLGVSDGWKAAAEATLAAYLDVAAVLGGPQTSEEPVDVAPLVAAATELSVEGRSEAETALSGALEQAAAAMAGAPLAEQRKRFGPVSEAAIELAERSPRTAESVGTLYVARCPMVDARWLQADQAIANPYYATTMKACGEVVAALPARDGAGPGDAHGGHR